MNLSDAINTSLTRVTCSIGLYDATTSPRTHCQGSAWYFMEISTYLSRYWKCQALIHVHVYWLCVMYCYVAFVICWDFSVYIIYVWPLAAIRIPAFHDAFKENCTRTWCLINQRCSVRITLLYLHMQVNRRGIFWQLVGVSSSVQKGC